jgi:hypothetical protein
MRRESRSFSFGNPYICEDANRISFDLFFIQRIYQNYLVKILILLNIIKHPQIFKSISHPDLSNPIKNNQPIHPFSTFFPTPKKIL